MTEDTIFYLSPLSQMQDDQVGCIVGNESCQQTNDKGHGISCLETNLRKHQACASYHSIDQSYYGHVGAHGCFDSMKKIDFFFTFAASVLLLFSLLFHSVKKMISNHEKMGFIKSFSE